MMSSSRSKKSYAPKNKPAFSWNSSKRSLNDSDTYLGKKKESNSTEQVNFCDEVAPENYYELAKLEKLHARAHMPYEFSCT